MQKVLARAGLGSRRGCEELILQGRVTVAGRVVRELGTRVDPTRERIAVDGEPIRVEPVLYFAVHKPRGYVSTSYDPAGRPRVIDLLPEIPERVYTVGRLDEESTGLMILTNDGALAHGLAHPRFGVEKLYRALVAGLPSPATLARLTEGIWLSEGKVRARRARIVGRQGRATVLELVLAEGKKRELRRMLARLGHKVMSLNRLAIGPITLKGLPVGECRPLSRREVDLLRKAAAGLGGSVAHFPDAEPSPRPRPAGHPPRPRPAEPARSARDQAPSARDQVRPAPHPDAPAPRPPRRPGSPGGRSQQGSPPPARRQQRRQPTSLPHGGRAARPPRSRTVEGGLVEESGTGTAAPPRRPPGGTPRRSAGPTPSPRAGTPPRRRIIGLEGPEAGPGTDRPLPDGRRRKRPPRRKPRPPRRALHP